jgi:hypothetical protein
MPKKTFEEIIAEELNVSEDFIELTEEMLNEVYIPITPLLAFLSFKRKSFDYLKNNKLFVALKNLKKKTIKTAGQIKGEANTGVEKIRSEFGITSGEGGDATVYSYSKEQLDFLTDLRNKYGKEIIKEIKEFRREVLAPYQLLKRIIKKNYRITPKEVLGMTRQEFEAALESGRKKIERRGPWFNEKFDEHKGSVSSHSEKIKEKENLLTRVENGERPNEDLLRPVIEKISGSTKKEVLGKYEFSFSDLEMLMDLYNKTKKQIQGFSEKKVRTFDDNKRLLGYYKTLRDIEDGKIEFKNGDRIDHSESLLDLKETFKKYRNRKSTIADKSKVSDSQVIEEFKKQLKDEIKDLKGRKSEHQNTMAKLRVSLEFNDNEAKIWKLKDPTRSEYSGKLSDFIQAISIEDFDRVSVQYLKKDDEIITAEKRVEAEIKAFERKLQKIVDEEDFKRLKSLRLISNIITMKEIRDPSKIMKTNSELDTEVSQNTEQEENIPTIEKALNRFREIASSDYPSLEELNNDKKEAEDTFKKFENIDDKDAVNTLRPSLNFIRNRTELKKQNISSIGGGIETDISDLIDINQIENMARKIIAKDYKNDAEDLKQDIRRLNNFIDKFKEQDANAEKKLEEITFLLDRAKRKTSIEVNLGREEGVND